MSELSIDEIRRLGLIELRDGTELARVNVKWNISLRHLDSFAEVVAAAETWRNDLAEALDWAGAEIVPDTFTRLGQSLQVLVPVATLPEFEQSLDRLNSQAFLETEIDLSPD